MSDRALSWDEQPIPPDKFMEGGQFVELEPGEYEFTVFKWERAKHEPKPGSPGNLPACPKAVIHCRIESEYGTTIIRNNLFLHTKCTGLIADFFTCLGLRKKGDELRFDWDSITGRTGLAKVKNRVYNGKTYNEIERFLPPAEDAPEQTTNNLPEDEEPPF